MKSLKFDHDQIPDILSGKKTSTWRLNDDKDISVDDTVQFIDKVDPENPKTWRVVGEAMINQVTQKRLADIDPHATGKHESFASFEDMIAAYRGRYGDAVDDPHTRMTIIDFTFKPFMHPMPLAEGEEKNTTQITEVKLYADGGSRGNPGPSASGFGLLDMDNNLIMKRGIYLGITTNNQAEYKALKFGLEEAQKRGVRIVHVYMDSLLVVNQMLGKYKVRNADLWPVHQAIKQQVANFESITFTQVPRALNKLADSMVNMALDAEASSSRT